MGTRRTGFTLIELLVATALMAIVVMYLMQAFTVQHRTYTVVENVSEAQNNSRAIAGLMEADLRAAGFMVPEGAAVCGLDATGTPDTIYVSASDLLDPSGVDDPDVALALTATTGGFVTGTSGASLSLANSIIPDGDAGFFDTDADGTMDSDFALGMGVIVVDTSTPSRGAACGRITTLTPSTPVPGSALVLGVTWESQMATGTGVAFRAVPAHVYDVDTTALTLRRDGVVLATDVEDLQVSYFFDNNDNGLLAANRAEEPGTASPGTTYDSDAWQGRFLREIRLNFVVRSRGEDPNKSFNEGRFQAAENRVGPTTADGFRRRLHRAIVRTRNVGFRDLT